VRLNFCSADKDDDGNDKKRKSIVNATKKKKKITSGFRVNRSTEVKGKAWHRRERRKECPNK
jgi:hypothetical protein